MLSKRSVLKIHQDHCYKKRHRPSSNFVESDGINMKWKKFHLCKSTVTYTSRHVPACHSGSQFQSIKLSSQKRTPTMRCKKKKKNFGEKNLGCSQIKNRCRIPWQGSQPLRTFINSSDDRQSDNPAPEQSLAMEYLHSVFPTLFEPPWCAASSAAPLSRT